MGAVLRFGDNSSTGPQARFPVSPYFVHNHRASSTTPFATWTCFGGPSDFSIILEAGTMYRTILLFFAACAFADNAGHAVFTMRERLATWGAKERCPDGTLAKDRSYSKLAIYVGGEAEERTWVVPACTDPEHCCDWKPLAASKLRKFRIPPAEYHQFDQLLSDPNVARLTSFLNAGPGVGDYEIEIHRAAGVQRISGVSLMPDHIELRRDSTLLRLICGAKQIAGTTRRAGA